MAFCGGRWVGGQGTSDGVAELTFWQYGGCRDGGEQCFVSSACTAGNTGVDTADWSTTETTSGGGSDGRGCHARVVEPCTLGEGATFVLSSGKSGCLLCATSTVECEEYQ